MGDRDILAPDNRQGTKLVKTKSSSAESVGRARFHSRFNTGAVFDEANGLLAPMERLPKIDGARRPQAARTPTMAEFATSIAHEISQPLTSVVLNAEASLRWLTRNDPDLEEARRAILAVAKEGMRAGEMIRSLLEKLEDGMADQSPFSTSNIHHLGLRVEDAEAVKRWLTTMLGFSVEREFQFAGHDFVFLSAGGAKSPVIELIGGPLQNERQTPENISDILKLEGWNHVCLQVRNVEECVADLRRRGVKVLIDVMVGASGFKIAFIADPWGNLYELLELAGEENRTAP